MRDLPQTMNPSDLDREKLEKKETEFEEQRKMLVKRKKLVSLTLCPECSILLGVSVHYRDLRTLCRRRRSVPVVR